MHFRIRLSLISLISGAWNEGPEKRTKKKLKRGRGLVGICLDDVALSSVVTLVSLGSKLSRKTGSLSCRLPLRITAWPFDWAQNRPFYHAQGRTRQWKFRNSPKQIEPVETYSRRCRCRYRRSSTDWKQDAWRNHSKTGDQGLAKILRSNRRKLGMRSFSTGAIHWTLTIKVKKKLDLVKVYEYELRYD